MKYLQGNYLIVHKQALAKDIFSLTVLCPEIAVLACPGQFVHILPKGFSLRRPISIAGIDKKKGTLRIVFAIKHKGTQAIADLNQGDYLDMIAPLGHGFTLLPDAEHVILSEAESVCRRCFRSRSITQKKQLLSAASGRFSR